MFQTVDKLSARIESLSQYRYKNAVPITGWQVQEDKTKLQKYPPQQFTTAKPFKVGDTWTGRDYYLWIQTQVKPEPNRLLLLDFGNFDEGFESLLFVNGTPYQGVDSNHQEVYLDSKFVGTTVTLSLKLWSGLEGGGPKRNRKHRFNFADFVSLDAATDDLSYTAQMLIETVKQLADDQPVKHQLLEAANETFNCIDWANPGDDSFYASVKTADSMLKTSLDQIPKTPQYQVSVIGHTHIDVAWLWRVKHTREKAARSFSTVLRYMEQFPEYKFMQSSPQIYQFIKEDYPELFQQIKQRVKEGRWEADGAMWLEADCNMPSGESLTRQILHGAKFFKQEFNQDIHYLWLPDVFGYSWALPQILKLAGINTFMTTKISWNEFNQMPHDTFWWRGIDGSEVLTHFITTPVVDKNRADWAKPWYHTYTGGLNPEVVLGTYRNYKDKAFNSNMLVAYGLGDGGGGVTREMLEDRRRLDKMPGLPSVKPELARDYFARLHETVAHTKAYVATWDGELYLEYHRGTYTSQAQIKRWNRKTEIALRDAEILNALNGMNGGQYPDKVLYKLWEVLLRNQFHDIIPGSAMDEVYADSNLEYTQVWAKLNQLAQELGVVGLSPKQVAQPDNYQHMLKLPADPISETSLPTNMQVVNTAGWQTDLLVKVPTDQPMTYLTDSGKPLVSVIVDGLTYIQLKAVQPLTATQFQAQAKTSNSQVVTGNISGNRLETKHYVIKWNEAGQLTSVFDLDHQKEVLKGLGNVLEVFEDKPLDYDAWNIDLFYKQKCQRVPLNFVGVKTNNALFIDLCFEGQFKQSTIKQTWRLYQTSRRIDFQTKVDWHQHQELLKVAFNVNVRSTQARFDIQYGNVLRPTHWNTSWDMAKFETVGHQWADLSQRDYGVALLNDCKYGYDVKDQTMKLSLIKSGIHPDPDADNGHHQFTYSLYPHSGDFISGRVVQAAWSLNSQVQVFDQQSNFETPLRLDPQANLFVDALKLAEDQNGWILRIHDYTGGNVQTTVQLKAGYQFQLVDLLERPLSPMNSGDIKISLNPYQIKTYRIIAN